MTDPDFIDTSTTLLNACRMLSEELTFRGDGGMRLIQHFADAIMAHCVAEARKPDPAICHLPMPIWSSNGDEVIGEDDTKECGCAMPCAYHGEIKRRSTETRAALEEVIGSADAHMRAVDAARAIISTQGGHGDPQASRSPQGSAAQAAVAGSTPAACNTSAAARERLRAACQESAKNEDHELDNSTLQMRDAAEALLALPSEPAPPSPQPELRCNDCGRLGHSNCGGYGLGTIVGKPTAPAQPGEAARAWRERAADIVSRCLVGGGTAYKQLHDVFDEAVAAWTAAEQRADAEKQITRQLLIRIDGLKAELREARNERETVTINRNDLRVRIDRLASERDAAVKRAEAAEEQSDASVAECDALRARLDALVAACERRLTFGDLGAEFDKAIQEAQKP